jgi:hypothetical protein
MLAKEPVDRPSLLRVKATVEGMATPPSKQVLHTGVRTDKARSSNTKIKFAIAGMIGALAMLITFFAVRSIRSEPSPTESPADTRAAKQESRREAKREAKREARREAKAETKAAPEVKADAEVEPPPPPGFWPADTPGNLVIQWKGSRTARFTVNGKAASANEPVVLPPGQHKVAIFLGGKISKEMVTIVAGETTTVPIKAPVRAPSRDDSLNPLNNELR